MEKTSTVSNFLNRIPGSVYLWLAVIIFATSNSVTRKLTELGAQHLIDGRNPISFCNVLFVGNICAFLVLIFIYRGQLSVHTFQQFSLKDWGGMVAVALLGGALAPGVILLALSSTMVNNVVLVGRIEPPLTLALSIWLLRERTNRWQIAGALVSFIGVVVMVGLQGLQGNSMAHAGFGTVDRGEILPAVGAVALAVSSIISKARLKRIPVGIFTIVRTGVGTVIFFFTALYLFGSVHFIDAFSPFLWKWMLLYGTLIVVVGESSWLTGLKKSSVAYASLAAGFNPIAAALGAYVILGEVPTLIQYFGGSVILCGIMLSQIGTWRMPSPPPTATKVRHPQEMETGIGFKGI